MESSGDVESVDHPVMGSPDGSLLSPAAPLLSSCNAWACGMRNEETRTTLCLWTVVSPGVSFLLRQVAVYSFKGVSNDSWTTATTLPGRVSSLCKETTGSNNALDLHARCKVGTREHGLACPL